MTFDVKTIRSVRASDGRRGAIHLADTGDSSRAACGAHWTHGHTTFRLLDDLEETGVTCKRCESLLKRTLGGHS